MHNASGPLGVELRGSSPPSFDSDQMLPGDLRPTWAMDFYPANNSGGSDPLCQLADQLEQVAHFMSRADARGHVLEKAAECRAKAVLNKVMGRSRSLSNDGSFPSGGMET